MGFKWRSSLRPLASGLQRFLVHDCSPIARSSWHDGDAPGDGHLDPVVFPFGLLSATLAICRAKLLAGILPADSAELAIPN
jgi:hypothetical protein